MDGDKKDEEKKPPFSGSLFAAKPSTGGLFGGNATSGGSGLFSNSNSGDKPAGSLFGNTTGTTSGSLFGNANGGSLFGNKDATNGSSGNLFGGQSNGLSFLKPSNTTSLFGNTKPTGSLFGQNKSLFGEGFGKAPEKTENEEDGENSDGAYKNEEEPPSVKLED